MQLFAIGRDGTLLLPHDDVDALPAVTRDVLEKTADLYARVGHVPPWVGYLAFVADECVGACGFTGPPREGRVEIAYSTFPGHERRGYATRMARALIAIASATGDRPEVFARTKPAENASTRVLQKLGFALRGRVQDDDDAGVVWEWKLARP